MERLPDWLGLWRELVEAHTRGRQAASHPAEKEIWRTKARGMDRDVQRLWAKPDLVRAFVLAQLDSNETVLDIGAGTGAWAALMARTARQVTAVEPAEPMIEVMRERLVADGIPNVTIVEECWPEAKVEPHDYTLCSHAMYGAADLAAFVRRMNEVTRRTCFFVIRAPALDGVMAEAAAHVWGHPHDSPNFIVAFNAVLEMGIYPNVLMGELDLWEPWSHPTAEDALKEIKWRLDLVQDDRHDRFLADLLRRRLRCEDGRCMWPGGMRTALMYWPGQA